MHLKRTLTGDYSSHFLMHSRMFNYDLIFLYISQIKIKKGLYLLERVNSIHPPTRYSNFDMNKIGRKDNEVSKATKEIKMIDRPIFRRSRKF